MTSRLGPTRVTTVSMTLRSHKSLATTEAQHQMERRLLLDVVVAERAPVLELLPGEDQALLVWRDTLLVLDLRLDVVDRVAGLDVERDRLPCQRLDKDLHAAAQPQHQVERGLLLDVVVAERAPVLQLLAGEDQALLVRRDPFLVLDLGLHVVDGVTRLDVERDRLPRERLDKDLHAAPEPQDQVERGL